MKSYSRIILDERFTVASAAGLSASLTGPALVLIGLLQGAGCRRVLGPNGLWVEKCTSLGSELLQCAILLRCA